MADSARHTAAPVVGTVVAVLGCAVALFGLLLFFNGSMTPAESLLDAGLFELARQAGLGLFGLGAVVTAGGIAVRLLARRPRPHA